MRKAIFLDRDGVINEDIGYVKSFDEIKLIKEAPKALKLFKEMGFENIVITNQAVVSRGWVTEKDIDEIHKKMNEALIQNEGNPVDKYYFCPHHPHSKIQEYGKICNCRKPAHGLITKAAIENEIDLNNSWMIGDRITDIVAGKNAGCKTILIQSPNNKETNVSTMEYDKNTKPDFEVKDLIEAAEIIRNMQ